MRNFLVLFVAIFSWQNCLAQNLPNAHKGTLLYRYYKIDFNQAKRLHRSNTNHIDSFLNNLVLEVPNDSFGKIFPDEPGNYILVWVQNTTIYYKNYTKPFLYVNTSGVLGEGQLKLYSFGGDLVTDAKVKFNSMKKEWQTVEFNDGCACYPFDNKIEDRLMSIEYEGNFDFYRINNAGLDIPSIDYSNPYAGTKIYPGYMVFNKPKYRHFDTLRFKAFVVNTDGRPLRRKMDVILSANGVDGIVTTIKPKSPGAYIYEFIISDSLRLNSNITVSLKYKNEIIKQNSVFVEDYELKKANYAARMLRNSFNLGDPVEVVVEAYDANRMPMLDARVKISLAFQNASVLYPENFMSHDTILKNLFSYNEMIGETGTSIIEIPKGVFLPMLANYRITVDQINADGEYQSKIFDFLYNANQHYYKIDQIANQLLVNHIVDGKSENNETLRLVSYYQGQVFQTEIVTLPLRYSIHPAAQQIQLWQNDSLIVNHLVVDNASAYISVDGVRSRDSISAELKNPFGIDVYYRIFQNKKIVAKGFSNNFKFKRNDATMVPYYILYGYQWAGREHFFEKQLVVKEKELNIFLNMPKAIFPGETVDASIKITDFKNIPLYKVNSTAYSVNMEFPTIPIPELPYFGRRFPAMAMLSNFNIYAQNFSGTTTTNYAILEKFHIVDSNYYLNFMFPNTETIIYRKRNEYEKPEFTPIIISDGKMQSIGAIWLNDYLIYSANNEQRTGLVFRYSKGVYTLKIRSLEHTVIVDKFELKDFEKIFMSIDPNRNTDINTTISKEEDVNIMDEKMVTEIQQQTFFLDEKFFLSDSVWIETNNEIILLNYIGGNKIYKYHWYPELQKNLMSISGVEPGKVVMRINFDTFYFTFEPGNYYVLENGILAAFPLPYYPLNSELIANNYNIMVEYSLNIKPFYFKNDTRRVQQKKQETYRERELEKTWYQLLKFYSYQKYHKEKNGRLRIFNPGNLDINQLWLVNSKERKYSYASSGNRQYWDMLLKRGNYTAIVITKKGQIFIAENINLGKGSNYFLRLQKNRFKKGELSEIAMYQEIIHEVARPDISRAKLFPELSVANWTFKKDTSDYGSILGIIKDRHSLAELGNITVILEQNGYIKDAVMSNIWGEFIFRNVQEGEYMLKLVANGYRYTTIHRVMVKNQQTALVSLNLERSSNYIQEISNPVQLASNFISKSEIFGKGQINFKIQDALNGGALFGANVLIYNDIIKKIAVTNINGIAGINGLEFGEYQVIISYIGFQQVKLNLLISDDNKKYFEVTLIETNMAFNDVVIEVRKPLINDFYGDYSYNSEEINRLSVRGNNVMATLSRESTFYGSDSIIRGGRTDQVITYIDGILVRESASIASASDIMILEDLEIYSKDLGSLNSANILQENLNLLEDKALPNRLRTDFKDFGYWVPNLITDRNGMAYFKVTFPDNITQWENIIPAMDYHRNTGLLTTKTKAFLPYTAQLGIPRFLVKGDSVILSGKVFNYTDSTLKVSARFMVENEVIFNSEEEIKRQKTFNVPIVARTIDSLEIEFSLNNIAGFKEGEKRTLRILDDFIEKAEISTIRFSKDTTFNVNQENNETFGVIVFNDKRDFLRQQIDLLKNYNYGCVEQTASKLSALLVSKQLCNVIAKPFKDDKLVQRMIARLAKFQKLNGSWAWWQNDATDDWITIYVTKY